jgi:hypothetical protein
MLDNFVWTSESIVHPLKNKLIVHVLNVVIMSPFLDVYCLRIKSVNDRFEKTYLLLLMPFDNLKFELPQCSVNLMLLFAESSL